MTTRKVWSQVSKRKCDGSMLKISFEEATANEKEDVINFMAKYLVLQENFNKGAGIYKSEEAINEIRAVFNMIYDDTHTMICYEDKQSIDNPILGISMIQLEKNDDEDLLPVIVSKIKTPEVMNLLKIIEVTKGLCDEMKKSGLDKYYSGRGVCVHPGYSGLGIARELLRLRRVVSKEQGVPATGAWMTAIGSQKAAERDGWTTSYEIPFDELGRLVGCEFNDAPPMCKMMVAFIEK